MKNKLVSKIHVTNIRKEKKRILKVSTGSKYVFLKSQDGSAKHIIKNNKNLLITKKIQTKPNGDIIILCPSRWLLGVIVPTSKFPNVLLL